MNSKQVIVVRKDLNMRKGKIAAQVAHASMAAILRLIEQKKIVHNESIGWVQRGDEYSKDLSSVIDWLNGSFTKIVVGIDHERDLLQLSRDADFLHIPHALIQDSGRTEFNGIPTYTALAIGPYHSEEIDKLTINLPLL